MLRRCVSLLVPIILWLVAVAGASADEIKLVVWNSDAGPAVMDWYANTLVPAFEASHPGVKVEVVATPWGKGLTEKTVVSYAGGTGPDIIYAGAEFVDGYVEKGFVIPIDHLIAQWRDWADFLPPALGSVTYKGKVYGVPMLIDFRTPIVNKQIFALNGIDSGAPIKTWDDFVKIGKRLTRKNGDALEVAGFGIAGQMYIAFTQMVWQNGGEVMNAAKNAPTFNSEAGVDAFTYWVEALAQTTDRKNINGRANLINGKLAMDYNQNPAMAARDIADSGKNVNEILGILPGLKRKVAVSEILSNWMGIGSQSKHPDLAWEFLKFHASLDNYVSYINVQRTVPTRKSALRSDFVKANPWMTTILNYASEYGRSAWTALSHADLRDTLQPEISKAIAGTITPRAALDNAAQLWVPILNPQK